MQTPSLTSRSSQVAVTDADTDVPRSIARVLDVFEIVLSKRNCNLTDAAAAAELTPTTALRYLRALEVRGYIDRDQSGDFSAGPAILRIAASLRGGTLLDRLAAMAQPHLDALSDTTGESTYLAVSDGQRGTYVATSESSRAIRHVGWVGQDVGLENSALGEALLDPGRCAIRTGAVEADITAISMAIPASTKLGVAISIVGPAHRFSKAECQRHASALSRTVDKIERDLRTNGEDFTP